MKNVIAALVCTLGAVACGESRPAESPTTTTSVTTESTTTATPVMTAPATTPYKATAPSTGSNMNAPSDGRDMTQPTHDSAMDRVGTTDKSGAAPATTGAGASAPSSDNPGVANGTKDATNTKINDRDRHGALTPMNQGGGADRDITAAIRRAVVADKGLSFTAKNVKIITVNGKVTLRGPVKSDEEKSSIEAKAKAATGVAEVDNQLEVKK
jgi:hyperosmotically inducible protein